MARRPSNRAEKLWKRLGQWYGARLAENYGGKCPEEWCAIIDRTDDERIERALSTIKREHASHPPTLGEFTRAIPPKPAYGTEARSTPSVLCEHAMKTLSLCVHQTMRPWNYFGPVEDFLSRNRNNEIVRHPRVVGVVIPSCDLCDRPSHRVRLEDLPGSAVAANA